MAAFPQSLALAKLLVLLMSACPAHGDFLRGGALANPAAKLNPIKVAFVHAPEPMKFGRAKLAQLQSAAKGAQFEEAMKKEAEAAQAAKALAEGDSARVQYEAARMREEAARVRHDAARVQHDAAIVLKKGAEVAKRVKPEDMQEVVRKAQQAVQVLQQKRNQGGVAEALRGTTSRLADTVNQTSYHVSHFLRSYGPKASKMLTHSGDALACKISGDCSPPDGQEEAVVPFDPEDPENWAFWGFTVFVVFALCGTSAGVLRCMYFAGRKGSALLSEAMVPLTEPSAREMNQLRSADGLLG